MFEVKTVSSLKVNWHDPQNRDYKTEENFSFVNIDENIYLACLLVLLNVKKSNAIRFSLAIFVFIFK